MEKLDHRGSIPLAQFSKSPASAGNSLAWNSLSWFRFGGVGSCWGCFFRRICLCLSSDQCLFQFPRPMGNFSFQFSGSTFSCCWKHCEYLLIALMGQIVHFRNCLCELLRWSCEIFSFWQITCWKFNGCFLNLNLFVMRKQVVRIAWYPIAPFSFPSFSLFEYWESY